MLMMMMAVLCWSKAIKAAADWVGGPCLRALSPLSLSLFRDLHVLAAAAHQHSTHRTHCTMIVADFYWLSHCWDSVSTIVSAALPTILANSMVVRLLVNGSEWVSCTSITKQPIYGNWLLLLPMLMIAITAAVAGRRKWSTLVICMQAGANAGLMLLLTRVGPMSCWCQCCCCCLFADN